MAKSGCIVKIPVRLEEPGRILIFEVNEVLAFLPTIILGMIAGQLLWGLLFGFVSYFVWLRIKGSKGLYGLHAVRYWFLPKRLRYLPALPDSAITSWRS